MRILYIHQKPSYRPTYSVETALARVQNDLLQSLDDGKEGLVILLDLSSAFDTLDHRTLLLRLRKTYGISGAVGDWFASYMQGREQRVIVDGFMSNQGPIRWGCHRDQ